MKIWILDRYFSFSRADSKEFSGYLLSPVRFPKFLLAILIQVYRAHFSYMFGGACKFHPSCSEYALGCLSKHDVFTSIFLIVRRLMKCHPFRRFTVDPVPDDQAGGTLGFSK